MTDFGRRLGTGDMLKSVYDPDHDGDVDALAGHKTSHQDGGTDEIHVDDLSGELADDQPPKNHALADNKHTAATLAELNAKISDATLDKDTDTRTPAGHKDTHQTGGGDQISAAGLLGRVNLVDRGDPASEDFGLGVLTTNGAWQDLDCSSVVPAGAIAIQFHVYAKDDAAGNYIMFRKKGNTNYQNTQNVHIKVADITHNGILMIFCDTNRVIQYWASNTTWTEFTIVITGWVI